MKYCIPYFDKSENLFKTDEIIIKYEYMSNIVSLIDFLKEHINQRVIISIPYENGKNILKEEDYGYFKLIKDYNFTLRIHFDREVIKRLKQEEIPFYFAEGCSDWDSVHSFINLGVTDILIINEMGFYAFQIAQLAHSKGVKVRAYPNIAQASYNETPAEKRFFIIPNDVDKYEEYIDTLEIYGSLELIDALFNIYSKQKKWDSLLDFIIENFDRKILNCFIPKDFADRRISCGKKCLVDGRCNLCGSYANLAENLTKIRYEMYEKKRKI